MGLLRKLKKLGKKLGKKDKTLTEIRRNMEKQWRGK